MIKIIWSIQLIAVEPVKLQATVANTVTSWPLPGSSTPRDTPGAMMPKNQDPRSSPGDDLDQPETGTRFRRETTLAATSSSCLAPLVV
jgi:hypothetical protein